MKKHFKIPLLRDQNPKPNPFSDLSNSSNPNPNPNSHKFRLNRKNRTKETTDTTSVSGKPSQATKFRAPLPPQNPNPLKRKLSSDVIADVISDGGRCSSLPLDSGVKVTARMRPLNKDEKDEDLIVKKISKDSLSINGQSFTFDSVADTEATQGDIFELVGAPLVENCLAGFNSSVFAYGQTGSGKTYTMWGPANALLEENPNDQVGLTPRVFERLFSRISEEQIKNADKQLRYQCRCSFLEIYNEQITDLLDPKQKNLQIREDVKSGIYVENLLEECVSSLRDVIQLLLKGLSNRRTGTTSINAESSRSHSVFTCVVESHCKSVSNGLSSFKTSRINLVDLAGSERQKLTGAVGDRLKEAGNINRSLSQLGNLINILAEISQTGKQRHIPYRDSKLTFLLQDSLGGNAKLAMICAVSPARSCKNETFSTLRFAQRAKAIKNKAVVNEVMQDDVNVLREVIRQLKDELLRMKTHGNRADPDAAYANSWNARRSINLLKFSLNQPSLMRHVDDDGDEVMEIDEDAIDRIGAEDNLQSTDSEVSYCTDGNVTDGEYSQKQLPNSERNYVPKEYERKHTNKKEVDESDVIMEDETSEIENMNDERTPTSKNNDLEASISVVPSPTPSVSPTLVISSSRKSLRTSTMMTASQNNVQICEHQDAKVSSIKSPKDIHSASSDLRTTDQLAASLHHGLEIFDNHQRSSTFRMSAFRFSYKQADWKPLAPIEKVDVGIQTSREIHESPEDGMFYICSYCKNQTLCEDPKEVDENTNLQLVPIECSRSAEKLKNQIPKAVEKVLAGAIRREMALEDFCAKQTYEISQLNCLVQQYKHERECNAIIGQLREDKIIRLENLMDGMLPSEDFLEEELASLRKEHELLKEKYDNHPEVLRTKIELKRAQDELERLQNFFDLGEREVLVEEIHDLRNQLQYYCDNSQTNRHRKSLLKLTYTSEPSSAVAPLNAMPESTEEYARQKLEQERSRWMEDESQWITLSEELKKEVEASHCEAKQLKQEVEKEKRCSEELKEALRLAMVGHARMLEQYADLEEKHMQMLARQRTVQDEIDNVKKAAARAGVRGAELRFINALATEISTLKMEREKERQYMRDENRMLQCQLRDTAEAVQAAGELLVRLKEAEEAVTAAEKRAAMAEEEREKSCKQMEKLKKKHEEEVVKLNQIISESKTASYDTGEHRRTGDERSKEECEALCSNVADKEVLSKFTDPSSWFSGYDKCNI